MAKQAVALRLDPETLQWADEYAEERGVSRQVILENAVASFREDAKAGVPELRQMARRQSSVNTDPEVGVGDCPKRDEGLGHVWGSSQEDSTRPCRFCGTPGRAKRHETGPHMGEIIEPGYFDRATDERSDLYARLGRAAAARKAASK